MSLATRCPDCGTIFRVVQDQLRVSEGWVRCGRCSAAFNAIESLVELDVRRDATPPEPQAPWPSTPDAGPAAPANQAGAPAEAEPATGGTVEAPVEPVAGREAAQSAGLACSVAEVPDNDAYASTEGACEPDAETARLPEDFEDDVAVAADAAQASHGPLPDDVDGASDALTVAFVTTVAPETGDQAPGTAIDAVSHESHPDAVLEAASDALLDSPSKSQEAPSVPSASERSASELRVDETGLDDPVMDIPASSSPSDAPDTPQHPIEPVMDLALAGADAGPASQWETDQPGHLATPNASEPGAPVRPATPPSFLQRAERAERWKRPAVRLWLGLACLLATLMLVAQGLYTFRDVVAARVPAMRPVLAQACAMWGCEIGELRLIDALSVESSGLVRVEGQTLYRLSVTLRNRSLLDVAVPALDLNLTDAQGRLIARRVLALGELGVSARTIRAESELPVQASLGVGDRSVSGYTVEIFYP